MSTFHNLTREEVLTRIVSTPPAALQFYLAGLSIGLATVLESPNIRLGKCIIPFFLPNWGCVDTMPKGKGSRNDNSAFLEKDRLFRISKTMSRVLRHGADLAREGPLHLNLRDGASALVNEMIAHSAFRRLHATKEDIASCSNERDKSNKMRFELYTAAGGDRARAFQGHTVEAEPCQEHTRMMSQRFALHATQVASARRIVHEGFRLLTGRQEFHFVEAL